MFETKLEQEELDNTIINYINDDVGEFINSISNFGFVDESGSEGLYVVSKDGTDEDGKDYDK